MVASFERKTSGTMEKISSRTFENRVVLTKIVKFINLYSMNFFLYVAVNDQLSCCLLVGVR